MLLRLNHVLAALAGSFAIAAVWPWLVPPIPRAPALASTSIAATPTIAPLPPRGNFAATVERPLFSPSRRPDMAAAVAAAPAAETRYRLLGIVGAGSKKTAFIADNARRIEVTPGDTLDGWTVKAIGQDRVTLASPSGETVLRMKPVPVEPDKPRDAGRPQ